MFDKGIPQSESEQPMGWPEDAKRFLNDFYSMHHAESTVQKIQALESVLGKSDFHSTTGVHIPDSTTQGLEIMEVDVPNENILAGYEFELLEREQLIKPNIL